MPKQVKGGGTFATADLVASLTRNKRETRVLYHYGDINL